MQENEKSYFLPHLLMLLSVFCTGSAITILSVFIWLLFNNLLDLNTSVVSPACCSPSLCSSFLVFFCVLPFLVALAVLLSPRKISIDSFKLTSKSIIKPILEVHIKGEMIHRMYRNHDYFGEGSIHDTWRPLTIQTI